MRSLDVDPFSPVGIDPATMRFLDVFLLHCLLAESPPDTREEIGVIAQNQYCVAERGREPGVRLRRDGAQTGLAEWGSELLRDCAPIAEALDAATPGRAHREALAVAYLAYCHRGRTLDAIAVGDWLLHHGHVDGDELSALVEAQEWRDGADGGCLGDGAPPPRLALAAGVARAVDAGVRRAAGAGAERPDPAR